MTTRQPVGAKCFGKPSGRTLGNEMLHRTGTAISQCAADNLLHLTGVQIDAWTESAHAQSMHRTAHRSKPKIFGVTGRDPEGTLPIV